MITLAVTPEIVRKMRPGQVILPSIVMQPGRTRPWEPCYSVALPGPFEVIYDLEGCPIWGRSLYISAEAAAPIAAADGVAVLARLEAEGRPTYIHANLHRARANRKCAAADRQPIVAIRRGRYDRKPEYAFRVRVDGPGWLVACPDRALPCSAKVFLVVPAAIAVAVVN
ncbi:MAG: hypothetical protein HGA45_27590 [Chloroflexales bacterium]|nr:hypothetical protein [Chloroflexales bacterium]